MLTKEIKKLKEELKKQFERDMEALNSIELRMLEASKEFDYGQYVIEIKKFMDSISTGKTFTVSDIMNYLGSESKRGSVHRALKTLLKEGEIVVCKKGIGRAENEYLIKEADLK